MSNSTVLTIKLIKNFNSFQQLEPNWNALVCHNCANIFLTHAWLCTWWQVYGNGKELRIVTIWHGDELVGALPLAQELRWGKTHYWQFLGSGEITPNHLDVLTLPEYRPQVLESMAHYLYDRRFEWDVLELNKLVSESDFVNTIKTLFCANGLNVEVEVVAQCAYIKLPITYNEYIQSRTENKQRSLRRAKRDLLAKYPEAKFAFVQSHRELEYVMTRLIETHQQRWTAKGYPGAFASQQFRDFHYASASHFLETGQLWMTYLQVGDVIIAVSYCYQVGEILQGYLHGFDESWARYSPGALLKAFVIEEAIRRKLAEYDFLEGDEIYKSEWTTDLRTNSLLRVYIPTWRGILSHLTNKTVTTLMHWGVTCLPLKLRRPLWQFYLHYKYLMAKAATPEVESININSH